MNSIMVIHPYKSDEMWVFDDEKVGLEREPFVAGADRVIDRMVAQIPNAETGFSLLFSAEPFPGYQVRFEWRREEYRGNWYYIEALDIEGWLCPALFKYFETTPAEIYAQFKAKGG
jgi:Uma2 family endonuclease